MFEFFASNLRYLRMREDLSETQLSEVAGVEAADIIHWECGDSVPDTRTMEALASALKVSYRELTGEDPVSQTQNPAKEEIPRQENVKKSTDNQNTNEKYAGFQTESQNTERKNNQSSRSDNEKKSKTEDSDAKRNGSEQNRYSDSSTGESNSTGTGSQGRQNQVPSSNPEAIAAIRPFLKFGERIIWAGKPIPDKAKKQPVGFAVFMVFWVGFAVFWTIMATAAAGFFGLFGLPFVAIGSFILFGRKFVIQRIVKQTSYAITNMNTILLCTEKGTHIREIRHSDLGIINVSTTDADAGTIYGNSFMPLDTMRILNLSRRYAGTSDYDAMPKEIASTEYMTSLRDIPDAYAVYTILNRLGEESTRN